MLQYLDKIDNDKYKILIRSRTDIRFETDFTFDFRNDFCYIPKNYYSPRSGFINDQFMCGKIDYIKKCLFADSFQVYKNIVENSYCTEEALKNLINKNNCIIYNFPCSYYELRGERRDLHS